MSYTKIDVYKPVNGAAGVSSNNDNILIFEWDEVVSGYARDSKGVVIPSTIVMKPGCYMTRYYSTRTKTAPSYANEGDQDSTAFKHSVDSMHPGDSEEIMELIQNWVNKNCGVIVQKCDGTSDRLYGDPCHPMQLKPTGQDDSSARGQQLLWEGAGTMSKVPGIYKGNVTLESPLAVIAADETSPSVALGEGQYQLSDNTGATEISGMDDAEDGKTYTFLGSGGAFPASIPAGNDFLLKDGVTWNGVAGSQITFKAFKDGAATFKFIEVSRA